MFGPMACAALGYGIIFWLVVGTLIELLNLLSR